MSDTVCMMELEATVCAHRFIEDRWRWRSSLRCACGYTTRKYFRTKTWRLLRAHRQTWHWEQVIGLWDEQ